MNRYRHLNVYMDNRKIGTLALTPQRTVAFEYDVTWLAEGFSLNPFSLPLQNKVFVPKYDPFDGLFGAFADSLPDGWGRLLVDRLLLHKGINPKTIDSLNRLAIVGSSGMGALTYYPTHELTTRQAQKDYDAIAGECMNVLKTDYSDDLDTLFALGGSSGGARTVNGNGVNPGMDDIMAVADHIKLNRSRSYDIADNIRNIVQDELRDLIK